ncbi:hypothetical protein PDESU_03618 [Pontiella desulfatans]|uniref:Uncharacterized protein n=1 Tax=Pontiella desulfatans TaxID=2750659 RepID=A0A6C2U4P6_PONDE|nr:hypothetical protein [Pontiella desulfatans]VGO15038.1 hypothetical protein PDESU_03618 [Pontiella desulfatans]
MILLNTENTYAARFKNTAIVTACGHKGRGANTRSQNYRAFNYELEIFDNSQNFLGILCGGFPITSTTSHNSPLIKFFKAIGIFRNPVDFDPGELKGIEVRISVNNVCDSQSGLRSVVDHFHPAIV